MTVSKTVFRGSKPLAPAMTYHLDFYDGFATLDAVKCMCCKSTLLAFGPAPQYNPVFESEDLTQSVLCKRCGYVFEIWFEDRKEYHVE